MNGVRGEVGLEVEGRVCRLCLTLGALAEIETALGVGSLADLRARLPHLSARDLTALAAALLRGGGELETAARLPDLAVSPARVADAVARAFAAALEGGAS